MIEGVASVNEAAITGESAPVIRESGGDRSAVTGGTRVMSDWIKVRITAAPGSTFLDRMIALVEGAAAAEDAERDRAQHPARRHDDHLRLRRRRRSRASPPMPAARMPVLVLVALFVTLIPTTIGALLSAIGIAGMDRLVRFNVLAMSGRAVEAAGDVDTLLLDKTGTITLGNRQATEFLPLPGVDRARTGRRGAARLALRRDAGGPLDRRAGQGEIRHPRPRDGAAATRSSCRSRRRRGSAASTSKARRSARARSMRCSPMSAARTARRRPRDAGRRGASCSAIAERIAKTGGTPLAVAKDGRLLGVIHLKDIVKGGIRERFAELRRMGIRTVMITGDNPLTAAAIAAEVRRRRLPRPGDAGRQAEADPRGAGARASWSRCAATAPTTRRRWPRPMSAWR